MQIHIENAVTILCGGDSALNGMGLEGLRSALRTRMDE